MLPLSIAMMVRNEEKNLERCLKSLLDLFPIGIEIIILDTGSTDRTVEIAKKYTKNVYHQKWADNFSLHRNKSFSYCKGQWIMQIDADEEIIWMKKNGPQILFEILKQVKKGTNAIAIPLKDWRESSQAYMAEMDISRIFRNGHVKYVRRVHNDPQFSGEALHMPQLFFLKHYGYDLSEEQKLQKAKRTIGLLEKELEENPTDYDCYFYLSQAYGGFTKDIKKAVENAEKYISFKDKLGKHYRSHIYHFLASVGFMSNDLKLVEKWVSQGLKIDPHDLDLNFDLMILGIKTKNQAYIGTGSSQFVRTYRDFKNYRYTHPGKFFFYYNIGALAEAMYYLIKTMLIGGMSEYATIQEVLKNCPEKLAAEIRFNLDGVFKDLGIEKRNEQRIITPAQFSTELKHHNSLLQKTPGAVQMQRVVKTAN